jgi:hypothetical protein
LATISSSEISAEVVVEPVRKNIINSNVIKMKRKRSLKLVKDFATVKLKKERDASQ